MAWKEFAALGPGDAVVCDGPTGRVRGVVRCWLGSDLLVCWGHGREAYTHPVTSCDAERLRLERKAVTS